MANVRNGGFLKILHLLKIPIFQMGFISIFMLANSWVGQNFGSIELYFYFILEWTVVLLPKELNRRKEKTERIH